MTELFTKELNPIQEFKVKGDHFIFGAQIDDGATALVDNSYYQFPRFTIWKVYLDLAKNFEAEAIELLKEINRQKHPGLTVSRRKLYSLISKQDNIWKYFSTLIADYIFSFTALETYINSLLGDYKPTQDDYRICEPLVKKIPNTQIRQPVQDILKECNLYDKLFFILPLFFSKKGKNLSKLDQFKEDFRKLESVRNNLIHLKVDQIRTGQNSDGSFNTVKLWNTLSPKFSNTEKKLSFYPYAMIDQIINFIDKIKNRT